jgi:hypothetical protein
VCSTATCASRTAPEPPLRARATRRDTTDGRLGGWAVGACCSVISELAVAMRLRALTVRSISLGPQHPSTANSGTLSPMDHCLLRMRAHARARTQRERGREREREREREAWSAQSFCAACVAALQLANTYLLATHAAAVAGRPLTCSRMTPAELQAAIERCDHHQRRGGARLQ